MAGDLVGLALRLPVPYLQVGLEGLELVDEGVPYLQPIGADLAAGDRRGDAAVGFGVVVAVDEPAALRERGEIRERGLEPVVRGPQPDPADARRVDE